MQRDQPIKLTRQQREAIARQMAEFFFDYWKGKHEKEANNLTNIKGNEAATSPGFFEESSRGVEVAT